MLEQAAVGEQTAVTLEETRPVELPPVPPPEPPPDREIWPWLLVVLVLVLAGIAAVYFATRDDHTRANQVQATQTVVQTVPPATTSTPRPVQAARVAVPRLVGLPAPTALKRLQEAGLTGTTRGVTSRKPRNQVVSQAPAASRELAKAATVTLNVSKGAGVAPVADVVGQSTADALTTIRAQGFKAKLVRVPSDQPAGQVVAQAPGGGTNAQTGTAIRLNLSDGTKASSSAPTASTQATSEQPTPATTTRAAPPATSPVTVPDLEGTTLVVTRRQLRRLGLVLEIRRVPSALPRDTIVAQARKPGTTLKHGDHLLVTVSSGPKQTGAQSITVPDVTGEDEATARQDLENAGLVVRTVDQDATDPAEDGVVIDQAPTANESVPANSTVTIYVGRSSGG